MALFSRRRAPAYSIFFATDLHGSEKCFRKFLRAAEFYRCDALMLGGDLTGKLMVPIVERPDGTHSAHFLDQDVVARTPEELDELERNIRFNGYYVHRCTPAELSALSADSELQRTTFRQVIREELERWMALADERLADAAVPCVGIAGNDDEEFVGEILSSAVHVHNGEDGIAEMGPYQVLSCGYSNPTPWNSPREVSEEELSARMEAAAVDLEPGRPTLFNVHVPPFNSGLDMAPALTEDLKLRAGQSGMSPVGSTATVELIERYQPVASFHGHVHESRAAARIGRTLAVNPGSEYNVGVLRGVITKLDGDGGVLSHQFVAA